MEEEAQIAVIIVPFPCQSHLNQLLQLSAVLCSHGLPVHYLGSATHNRQVKLRADGLNPNIMAKIQFHDLPTPPIDSPEPDTTSSAKQPLHLYSAIMTYINLRHQIGVFSQELAKKVRKIVVIYDRVVAEAIGDVISIGNAEMYAFSCFSVFALFHILWEYLGKPFDLKEEINGLIPLKEIIVEDILNVIASTPEHNKERDGDIHNTFRCIERDYIHLMEREQITGSKKQWAFRPILQYIETKPRHKCLEWLDKQAPRSVILVSFGTILSLTKQEATEIAIGLEQSNQKFIWVLKTADKSDIFAPGESKMTELPDGFEQRIQEQGIIVREWAPQLEILGHRSIGGFMTHCGWNSCLESLSMGVPVAAWPMHSEQPVNAIFLTQVLKVGVTVREWRKKEELVRAFTVKNAVERLMGSEEGDRVRKRAEEISIAIKISMEEGGECYREIQEFIAHISR